MIVTLLSAFVALTSLSSVPQLAQAQANLAQDLGIDESLLTRLPGRAQARLEFLRGNRQRAAQAVQTPYLEIAGPGSNGRQVAQQAAEQAQDAIEDVLRECAKDDQLQNTFRLPHWLVATTVQLFH